MYLISLHRSIWHNRMWINCAKWLRFYWSNRKNTIRQWKHCN